MRGISKVASQVHNLHGNAISNHNGLSKKRQGGDEEVKSITFSKKEKIINSKIKFTGNIQLVTGLTETLMYSLKKSMRTSSSSLILSIVSSLI